MHDHNAKIEDANGSKSLGSNNNKDLLVKLLEKLGLKDTNNTIVSNVDNSCSSKHATVATTSSLPIAYGPTGYFTPCVPTYGPVAPIMPAQHFGGPPGFYYPPMHPQYPIQQAPISPGLAHA
ncbi:hypothetical protein Tco_1023930 [Tanacetum coccineum]